LVDDGDVPSPGVVIFELEEVSKITSRKMLVTYLSQPDTVLVGRSIGSIWLVIN